MLFRFQKGVDSSWNCVSKYFRLGCVLLEGEIFSKFFQVRSEKWTKIRLYQMIQEVEKRTLEP